MRLSTHLPKNLSNTKQMSFRLAEIESLIVLVHQRIRRQVQQSLVSLHPQNQCSRLRLRKVLLLKASCGLDQRSLKRNGFQIRALCLLEFIF